ncbi:hypothetical protein J2T02_005661 [Chitinophaga terrae (ex Kim and Jung 2007)]|uniref:hypothetical protein n=1 Tax=Chitinophaga terrae (ex Kim and Jung 2007) TaxID=408074 RepID=UPI002783EA42|nr:hypothetical protein [Chitinophaga terrae (ex Kim and Jung 2007)]MDQ0110509.1 hypothetical protein [Chitinophaga terrae (ex Kim and Jung 2007)]
MKNIFIWITFMITPLLAYSQTTSWTTLKIEGVGTIGLPSNMEVQGGIYREITDRIKEINGINASRVIFQQKNLNSLDKNSFQTYARVFIRTEQGSVGDFKKLSETITKAEANEVNATFKSKIEGEALRANASILEWYDAKVLTLNGLSAINFGYKRQIGSNKPVIVEIYMLQNNDRFHTITFEHRLDGNDWEGTFNGIKSTIKIIQK